ncbi:MAG: nucleoside-diphosphate kinase [Archaeoglobales archaeon]|nr:nucleoside-diphosphate kinase [Archaeoglobales archaeon]
MERTFVMLKPDAVQRGIVGEIISRFERKGFKIVAMKMLKISRELAEKHYAEHKGKPFFEGLLNYITSSPVIAMVIEGKNAVKVVRSIVGATNPAEAQPGTIRGDYGLDVGRNVIHASDSLESAKREIALFFSSEEIYEYSKYDENWIYEKN